MKKALISLAALAVTGCASIENAGHAAYSVKPFAGPAGELVCCAVEIKDGKEFAARQIQFQTNGAAYGLTISEGASKAFKGQALAVKAINVLPTMGLGDILAPQDK